jgi:two-component system, OmpR family, phosphate regulon sensor histidine kinase PhoR
MNEFDVAVGALGALLGAVATYLTLRGRQPRGSARARPDDSPPYVRDADRIAQLVDALPFAAFTVDPRTRVQVFNAAAGQLFEVDRLRAVGRAIIEVIPSLELERMLQHALDGETTARDVTFGAGSRARFFGVTAKPYDGGAIAIAADRTAYLAAERMRRDFISDVSHELRTPLSAMKLMLETVQVSDDDAEARALFLPQISGEVERMIRLVVDLLELARSESGAIAPRLERFDLGDVAMSTVNTFAQRADELGVALDVEAPDPVIVDADREQLVQVAMNLVDNALRHTPAGGSVTVEVQSEGTDALLVVRDTGVGIPFDDLPRIFERFYVVDRSRSRDRGGTGLGLAIAKHLVEIHGGTLVAESVYGSGASFTMRLPLPDPGSRP